MKIYLAARYGRRQELCAYAEELAERGHEVTSRWLKEHGGTVLDDGVTTRATDEDQSRFASEDVEDIEDADLLIFFAEEPGSTLGRRGGRHVELGVAIGLGIEVVVVGARENVFHYHPNVSVVATWEEALAALQPKSFGEMLQAWPPTTATKPAE